MTSAEYIAGKLAILFMFLIAVTFLPAMMLLLTQAIFAGNLTFIRNNIYLVPAITLFSLAQVLLASTTMLALSSLSKSSRFVGGDVCRAVLLHARRSSTRCAALPARSRVRVAVADRGAASSLAT